MPFKKLLYSLGLAAAFSASAAERIELFLTVTNTPVTGDTLTINSDTRTWTNAHSASTILTNLEAVAVNNSMTNLFFNVSAYPYSDYPVALKTDTNKIRFIFPVGVVVSASESGDWAEFSLSTNTLTDTYTVRVPFTVEAETNRTNIASMLTTGLQYSTNAAQMHWAIMGQTAGLTNNNVFTGTNSLAQGGWNNASLTNTLALSGVVTAFTNGIWNAGILISPTLTNGVNYGNAFSSPGSGSSSEQFGSGASAAGPFSVALGSSADASGQSATAIGNSAEATSVNDVVIGNSAQGGFGNNIAIGTQADANATNGIAIGNSATVGTFHTNSIALGNSVTTTKTNQLLLGSSSYLVEVPGRLEVSGTQTNAVLTGPTRVGANGGPYGTISISRRNDTGMAAGQNVLDIAGASYVKISGAGAAFSIDNITNSAGGLYDGLRVLIQNSEPYTMTIADDSGFGHSTTRIYTGTGADTSITNDPGFFEVIYDSAASRWGVITATN